MAKVEWLPNCLITLQPGFHLKEVDSDSEEIRDALGEKTETEVRLECCSHFHDYETNEGY